MNMRKKHREWGRLTAVLTAAAVSFSGAPMPAVTVMAAEAPVDKTVTAQFGTPVLDGEMDEVWEKASAYSLEQPRLLNQGSGEARVLWDDNALYVLLKVYDENLDKSSGNSYEQDSIEVFLDELYDGGAKYQSDDLHYRVNYENWRTTDAGAPERWYTAAKTFTEYIYDVTDGDVSGDVTGPDSGQRAVTGEKHGYIVEGCIRWEKTTPANGKEYGFDAQINAAENGRRAGTLNIFDSTGNAYQNPSLFGRLVLEGKQDGDQSGVYPFGLIYFMEQVGNMDLSIYTNSQIVLKALKDAQDLLDGGSYTQEDVDNAHAAIQNAIDNLDDGSGMTPPQKLPEIPQVPDIMTFEDGVTKVTKDNWPQRASEIKKLYEYYMYGPMPDTSGENVTYDLGEMADKTVTVTDPITSEEKSVTVKQGALTINVENGGRTGSFSTVLVVPTTPAPEGGYPVFSEMGMWATTPSSNCYYAASRGYASVTWNYTTVASDNLNRTGAFYSVYPYGKAWTQQTGALVAWSWGAGKILDVLEGQLGEDYNINAGNNILGGVSRLGKATTVAGVYEPRIKVVMPTCSGAGGMAMFRYDAFGHTYDMSALGGPSEYTYTTTEPLSSLQSTSEAHWFNDNFLKFKSVEQLPFEQYYLAALCADPDRYFVMVGSATGEDWVNAPSMNMSYLAAREIYDTLGLGDHLAYNVHLTTHGIILSDMAYVLDYCDVMLYGKSADEVMTDLRDIRTNVFLNEDNYGRYAQDYDPYVNKNLSDIDVRSLAGLDLKAESGVSVADVEEMLPKTVKIYVDTVRTMSASVTWDVAGSGFDSAGRNPQNLTVKGKVTLPEGILNPDGIPLEVSVKLAVTGKSDDANYGNVIVGNAEDSDWALARSLKAENILEEAGVDVSAITTGDGTADIKILWDDTYLYLKAFVADEDVYISGNNNEDEDSITFTLAKSTDAEKEVTNYVFTAGGAALKSYWSSGLFGPSHTYAAADQVYAVTEKTDKGWSLEACIEWSALGIEPLNGAKFAMEAVVNNCSSAAGKREFRRALYLTEYPQNMESSSGWFGPVTYNAGLYAKDLGAFNMVGKTAAGSTENIGRYDLLKYVDSFVETYVEPYPIKTSFDARILEDALAYALSKDADKDGIARWSDKLDEMKTAILKDNCQGMLMTKHGTPLVDGKGDDQVWENTYAYKTAASRNGQYAEIKTLWDREAMYVLVNVFDPSYDVTGTDAHTKDSVEFFFLAPEDAALNSFGRVGGQWRINRANVTTVTFGQNEPFYGKVSEMADGKGYVVEARLEFADGMEIQEGSVMNFDVAVNLCENGDRTEPVAWTSTDCYTNPSKSGKVVYLSEDDNTSAVAEGYNPYALFKVLDKALVMDREDYYAPDFDHNYDRAELQKYYDEAVSGKLSADVIQQYYDAVIAMMSKITYDGVHKSALGFEASHEFPDLFTMNDGSKVYTAEDWAKRSEEIQDLYEFYMYGQIPDAQKTGLTKEFCADGDTYTVKVTRNDITRSFTFKVDIPEGEAPEGGWPYIINYGGNISGAQDAGYAVVEYSNHSAVADTSKYKGIFYELYPECKGDQYANGVGPLVGRAWGAGLMIDCIEAGIGRLSELNPENSAVTGFSYLGKTALITGALEKRIKVTNPAHSGMVGAAVYRWSSQGKFYSADEYGFTKDWLVTRTEPIGQGQGQGAAWVKTLFADFLGADNTPFDTYMLLSLVAPRGLFVSAGYYDNGTDPEGMYASYLGAQQAYKLLGKEENIAFGSYPTEHAGSTAETNDFLAFCDYYFYGKELPQDFYSTVYDNSPDREDYDVIRIPQKQPVDKTALLDAVKEAEAIDAGKYTQDSYAELVKAIEEAKNVLQQADVTQAQIDAALAVLNSAQAGLVEKQNGSGDDGTDHSDENGGNEGGSESAVPGDDGHTSPKTYDNSPFTPKMNQDTAAAAVTQGNESGLEAVMAALIAAIVLAGAGAGIIGYRHKKDEENE